MKLPLKESIPMILDAPEICGQFNRLSYIIDLFIHFHYHILKTFSLKLHSLYKDFTVDKNVNKYLEFTTFVLATFRYCHFLC